jgi:hypothetical protein
MEILKVVGQVAGIGGLALGVVLIVFREVIRKNIFPRLSRDHAYKLLRTMVILVFVLGIVGMAVYVYLSTVSGKAAVEPIVLAEFDLDQNGNPIYQLPEAYPGHIQYQFRLYLRDASPDVKLVQYFPQDSTFADQVFSGDKAPDFRTTVPIYSWGDTQIKVRILRPNGERTLTADLYDALEQRYASGASVSIRNAINYIKNK